MNVAGENYRTSINYKAALLIKKKVFGFSPGEHWTFRELFGLVRVMHAINPNAPYSLLVE